MYSDHSNKPATVIEEYQLLSTMSMPLLAILPLAQKFIP
jgi:hypothetical protein